MNKTDLQLSLFCKLISPVEINYFCLTKYTLQKHERSTVYKILQKNVNNFNQILVKLVMFKN